MCPRPRPRMESTTAKARLTGPHSMMFTACSKCSRSRDCSGPTWMTPATVTSTSMGPRVASMRETMLVTSPLSATSHTMDSTMRPSACSFARASSSSSASRAQITTR